jgi:hypothetical protein
MIEQGSPSWAAVLQVPMAPASLVLHVPLALQVAN